MRVLTAMMAAGVLAAAAAPAGAATYVAYDQFQISGGAVSTGDFAAGYYTGPFTGAVTAFPDTQAACSGNAGLFCIRNGEASVAKAYAGTFDPAGSSFFQAGFLNLHADTGVNTAFQFVAPTAGTYRFVGSYQAHDVTPTGVDIGAVVGTTLEFSDTFTGGSRAFDFDADLTAGQRVSFLLGAAGNFTYDSTGFALTVTGQDPAGGGAVPEPATWAMMLLGFFGMGSALRSRRGVVRRRA